jgi:hypothetical protein
MTDCPIKIHAANGGILESTHIGEISLPHLPMQSFLVHVVPGLASMSLLAMGPLCDAGCTIEITVTTEEVKLHDNLVLQGNRAPPSLWIFQLPMNDSPVLPDNNSMLPLMNSAKGGRTCCVLTCNIVFTCNSYLGTGSQAWIHSKLPRSHCQDTTTSSTPFCRHCYKTLGSSSTESSLDLSKAN